MSTVTITQTNIPEAGDALPPEDNHAVSVSLQTWENTLKWARKDAEFLERMRTGYPRFFIPLVVRELSNKLLEWATRRHAFDPLCPKAAALVSKPGQASLLFPKKWMAKTCQKFLSDSQDDIVVLEFRFSGECQIVQDFSLTYVGLEQDIIYANVFADNLLPRAKSFWQHAGLGISSRCACFWLENAPFLRHPTKKTMPMILPLEEAENASFTLRQRISDLLGTDSHPTGLEDVYLYPSGMSAIYHAAAAINKIQGSDAVHKVAIFGFLYVDTFKVLSKVHEFDCVLYGYASASDLDQLEKDLDEGLRIDALYTEFPGNPLLSSPDLSRIHALASKHNFLFVVDDTIATSVNVSILNQCDVICTSLTKMFSGGCNVMGGSLVLNPRSKFYQRLCKSIGHYFEDTCFPLDVMVMEQNSANFESRVVKASRNAESLVQMLRDHPAVAEVFYPKGSSSQQVYDEFKKPGKGYGFLLSIRFLQPSAAVAFHDALLVAKGPSLGTNFTLCCAYTLIAHYSELEWAAKFGVIEHLVRISIGIEDLQYLKDLFRKALTAASEAVEPF
ncbi:pyridoxal phosphate-dependent transferase [Penicillium chermesinum]|uniref:Pyridoxal phosphate-dependent transferase n=1 Tax=Penicillium chermesinum TaxID=63820 RepID=A0A9W9NKC7_9EURO|nr:pyridoxal phosphate-dependent transferase [Penicillium chermesinum]KAJ5220268.1 pyridoxal phosphate-dependent transferase [Penicillium chermesinum]KAJ6157711.1 pyridoxal phosphate-dependent transferase [Penicillium chermesinum]